MRASTSSTPPNVYSAGESETMLGQALAGRRQQVVLATKLRGRMGKGPNDVGLSRLHIMEAVEASLKRLGTDHIDLYQIHRFDPLTNLEDTLRALDDLVRAGKVRYIGCSNLAAWQIMKSLAISRAEGLERFRCTQSYYSLAGRELEREIIPMLKDQHLGLLVWSPLAGGFLSGKFTREDIDADRAPGEFRLPVRQQGACLRHRRRRCGRSRRATRHRLAACRSPGCSRRTRVTSVIIGARKMEQLEDNLKSVDVTLSAEELKTLDDVSRLALEYPEILNVFRRIGCPDRNGGSNEPETNGSACAVRARHMTSPG